jgi:hypothetical protein
MGNTRDWLSRLLEMIPAKGTLDYRCFLGAPRPSWRAPEGSPTRKLTTGDILLFLHGFARALHGGSDAAPAPAGYA